MWFFAGLLCYMIYDKFDFIFLFFLKIQSETRLFSQIIWRRLISFESNLDLLSLLLRQKNDIHELNINLLKTIFLSIDYHILSEDEIDKTKNKIENDINSSRYLFNKLCEIIGVFYTFQLQNADLLINEDDTEISDVLISDELREYLLKIVINEYNTKYHILSQRDRKVVLRTLLTLQTRTDSESYIDELLTDINRFSYYKGTRNTMLTQVIDDKTEINGYKFSKQLQSDIFRNFLSENKLYISKAFVMNNNNNHNLFQTQNLNNWRFERLLNHKKLSSEQWLEDGNTRGPLFEWRYGGVKEGSGLHPSLNDIDLQDLTNDEYKEIFDINNTFDEDNALLIKQNNDINYKKIILRSICDVLLEYNQYKDVNTKPIAIFIVNNHNGLRNSKGYYQYLCDLFDVKCVVIDDINILNDSNAICNCIQSVI